MYQKQPPIVRFLHRARRILLAVRSAAKAHRLLIIFVCLTATWSFVVIMSALFLMPRKVQFSYAGQTCFSNPVFLPQSTKITSSASYSATLQPTLKIARYTVYSGTTCIHAMNAPKEVSQESIALQPFGISFLKKEIKVGSNSFPILSSTLKDGGKISAKDSLVFNMSATDVVFDYKLTTGHNDADKAAPCIKKDTQISCNLTPLGLEQAQTYTVTLQRFFNDRYVNDVTSQKITSIEPVAVTAASVNAGSTVYSIPTEITLTLSKPATKVTAYHLEQIAGAGRTALPATMELNGTTLRIVFSAPLPRSADIELTIEDIEATDHSFLATKYVLPFKTSGGPTVAGISIGSYKIPQNASFTIMFDVALTPNQVVADFAQVIVGGQAVAARASLSGHTLTITPNAMLGACTPFIVKILPGLTNEFGVGGGTAWSYSSRTICQSVFSIGTSVQGRDLTAYKFGTGASYVVYVGATHGNEKSSAIILNQWIEALEASPEKIPAGRSIIVIPIINPDGYAANTRTNANNVDLNRNFPASNWKTSVVMPDKSTNPTGGGSAPLSEPESAALAQYMLAIHPRLILTYHANAGVVIPNDSGDSDALAHLYDQKSNLYYNPNSSTGEIFEYDTTGAFEDWLHESPNITTLLIESWTMTGNEYSKHINALWAMAQS